MICPSCHTEIPDDSAFCTECGAAIPTEGAQPEEAPQPATCPSCGAPLRENAAFCTECGARVDALVPAAADADETQLLDRTACDQSTLEQETPAEAVADHVESPVDDDAPDELDPASGLDVTVPDMARVAAIADAAAGADAGEAADAVPAVDDTVAAPIAPEPVVPGADDAPRKGKGKGKVIGIAVGVIAVIALAGFGVWKYLDDQHQQELAEQQAAEEAAHAFHDVTVAVAADGWDTEQGSSRLPMHIEGEDLDGTTIDEVQYVDSDGEGIELRQGEYVLGVAASPIAADGTVFTAPDTTMELSIATDDPDEDIDVSSYGTFELEPVTALDVTDEQIEAAYKLALDDADENDDAPDADELRAAAIARRDEAVAQKEAEEAAAAEAAAAEAAREARHVVAAGYEFYLPEYWDGRVTVDVQGNTVTIYSKAYPRLDVCTIQVQRGTTSAWGDVASSCMGDVALGQGHYASVWANRWGYIIGHYYWMASSDPSTYYSIEEAEEIVDLQTGGAVSYEEIRDDMEDDGWSEKLTLADDYLRANIVNTITPL